MSISGFGCVTQYQVCSNGWCTDPGGLFQLANDNGTVTELLGFNSVQVATFETIWRSLYTSIPFIVNSILGADMLRSKERVAVGKPFVAATNATGPVPSPVYYYSAPISDNQWELEAQNLQHIVLAWLQRSVVEHVAPSTYILSDGVPTKNFMLHSSDPGEREICSQQQIRSSGFSSFSVFGLVCILIGGLTIAALACAVPILISKAQLRSRTADALHRRAEWYQRDILQLAREISESENPQTWTGSDSEVPTTLEFGKKMKWKPWTENEPHSLKNNGDESIEMADYNNSTDGLIDSRAIE
jgi:hypothetical protein